MTIRCIYSADPGFPATDQHPDALRVTIGAYIVDYIGALPTQADVDAILNPPPTQDQLDAEAAKQYAKLTALKRMTPAQIQTWVDANVTNLAQAQDAIKTLAIAVSILARRL
jgi:hypothetical protein